MESIEAVILRVIFEDLVDRSGFDAWWDEIDDETKREIRSDLRAKIAETLKRRTDG